MPSTAPGLKPVLFGLLIVAGRSMWPLGGWRGGGGLSGWAMIPAVDHSIYLAVALRCVVFVFTIPGEKAWACYNHDMEYLCYFLLCCGFLCFLYRTADCPVENTMSMETVCLITFIHIVPVLHLMQPELFHTCCMCFILLRILARPACERPRPLMATVSPTGTDNSVVVLLVYR